MKEMHGHITLTIVKYELLTHINKNTDSEGNRWEK